MKFILDELYEQGKIYILKIYETENHFTTAYISPDTGCVLCELLTNRPEYAGWYLFESLSEYKRLDIIDGSFFGKDVTMAVNCMMR